MQSATRSFATSPLRKSISNTEFDAISIGLLAATANASGPKKPQITASDSDSDFDLEKATRDQLVSRVKELSERCSQMESKLRYYKAIDTARGTTKALRGKSRMNVPDIVVACSSEPQLLNRNPFIRQEVMKHRLSKFPLFQDLKEPVKTQLVEQFEVIKHKRGDFIIKKGEPAKEMFFILKGTVSVISEDGKEIATLKNDAFFGELGVMFDVKRTASITVTSEECWLFVLKRDSMEGVLKQHKDLMEIFTAATQNWNNWFKKLLYKGDENKVGNDLKNQSSGSESSSKNKEESEESQAIEFGGEFVAVIGANDLSKIVLFENADADFLMNLSFKLRPIHFKEKEMIVKRGEDGDEMFLILTGGVEVVSDDLQTIHATMTKGSFFGEVGLLLKTKRTANVRACGPTTTLLKLTKDDLSDVTSKYPEIAQELKKAAEERFQLFQKRSKEAAGGRAVQSEIEFELNHQNLSKVGLFSKCSRNILDDIATVMTRRNYKAGEFIVRCNQTAEEMFFLVHGVAEVLSEFNEIIANSDSGSYFGEVGILHNMPRIASVRAKVDVVTYVLTRSDLLNSLGKYPAVMEEVMTESQNRLQNYLMRNILA